MNLLDALTEPWAITPQKFEALEIVVERHLAGIKLDAESIAAAIGPNMREAGGEETGYTVQNGWAIINIDGVLAKKMNLFTAISGGMSTELITAAINDANNDPTVNGLILSIDSPGGMVDGTQQVGDAVAAAKKPVIAWVDGQCCSAAYWIAAQADEIYADSSTAIIGSIGVIIKHTDLSKANETAGRKVTHVTAGKYKAAGNSDQPLSQDDRDLLQGKVDYLCTLFVNAVAQGRNTDPATVWSDMGEGQTFYAQQAIDAGLIDGIISLDSLVSRHIDPHSSRQTNKTALRRNAQAGANNMFKSFATEAEYNDHMAAEFQRGQAAATVTSASVDTARAEGAAAERERITSIESVALAAQYPEVIKGLKADGRSTKADAALAILEAEGKTQAAAAAGRRLEIVPPVAASQPDAAAEAAAGAAAAATTVTPPTTALAEGVAHATKIRAHVATAKREGRTISSAEASAELDAIAKAAK